MWSKNGTDRQTGSPKRPLDVEENSLLKIYVELAKLIVLLSDNMESVCDTNGETFWANLPLQGCASLV